METLTQAGAILVDSREAARRLAVSGRTIWSMANDGRLPVCRIGRAVRFRVADLEAFAQCEARLVVDPVA